MPFQKITNKAIAAIAAVTLIGGGIVNPVSVQALSAETAVVDEFDVDRSIALGHYQFVIDSTYSQGFPTYTGVYGMAANVAGYEYALVRLENTDDIPALLLKCMYDDGFEQIKVYQYVPERNKVMSPEDVLSAGVQTAGGFRGGISVLKDGNGICLTQISGGNGYGEYWRIQLDGTYERLNQELIAAGNVFDPSFAAPETDEIIWHEITDLDGLYGTTQINAEEANKEAECVDVSQFSDGDRYVLSGTVGYYTNDEVIALQNLNPNYGYGAPFATYYIVILDDPQDLSFMTSDPGEERLFASNVSMINLSYVNDIAQYVGKQIIFSVDKKTTGWASGSSLPVSQPVADEMHILYVSP